MLISWFCRCWYSCVRWYVCRYLFCRWWYLGMYFGVCWYLHVDIDVIIYVHTGMLILRIYWYICRCEGRCRWWYVGVDFYLFWPRFRDRCPRAAEKGPEATYRHHMPSRRHDPLLVSCRLLCPLTLLLPNCIVFIFLMFFVVVFCFSFCCSF